MDEEQGLVVRVPIPLMPVIKDLAQRTGLPRSTIVRRLIEQGLANPPDWMQSVMEVPA